MQCCLVSELSGQDFGILGSAIRTTGIPKSLENLIRDIDKDLYQLWRLEGTSTSVLVVTCVKAEGSQRDLFIYLIAGFGWIDFLDEIEPELAKIAEAAKCTAITGLARNEALRRVYTRYGAKPVATLFRKELK